MEKYGWTRDNEGKLNIIWDTPENVSKAQEIVHQTFLGVNAKLGVIPKNAVARETAAIADRDASALAAETYLYHFPLP